MILVAHGEVANLSSITVAAGPHLDMRRIAEGAGVDVGGASCDVLCCERDPLGISRPEVVGEGEFGSRAGRYERVPVNCTGRGGSGKSDEQPEGNREKLADSHRGPRMRTSVTE